MKVKDITEESLKDYIGVSYDDDDIIIEILKDAAFAFISSYTGMSEEEIYEADDIAYAYMCIINEMYEKRNYTAEQRSSAVKSALNPCVKTILDMHSKNYVGWSNDL